MIGSIAMWALFTLMHATLAGVLLDDTLEDPTFLHIPFIVLNLVMAVLSVSLMRLYAERLAGLRGRE